MTGPGARQADRAPPSHLSQCRGQHVQKVALRAPSSWGLRRAGERPLHGTAPCRGPARLCSPSLSPVIYPRPSGHFLETTQPRAETATAPLPCRATRPESGDLAARDRLRVRTPPPGAAPSRTPTYLCSPSYSPVHQSTLPAPLRPAPPPIRPKPLELRVTVSPFIIAWP